MKTREEIEEASKSLRNKFIGIGTAAAVMQLELKMAALSLEVQLDIRDLLIELVDAEVGESETA